MTGVQPFACALVAISIPLVIGGMSMLQAQAPQHPSVKPETCMAEEIQEEIRAIMLKAVDDALRQHTIHVFDVWLKDPGDQPKRAIEGMRIGISAYLRTRAAIDRWDPPNCPAK